jgi:hypothetical protein
MERNGIHIIDLMKTQNLLEDACNAVSNVVADGRRILFVGTKKQAKEIIKEGSIPLWAVLGVRAMAGWFAHKFRDNPKERQAV